MAFFETRQFYRCQATGKVSPNFIEVLPRILTLDPDYYRHRKGRYAGQLNTLFEEIEIVPPDEIITPEMQELFSLKREIIQINKFQLFTMLKKRLLQVIKKSWDPDKIHFVMHSSGRDSRILSWLIRKKYLENGPEWLGRTVFLCSQQEGPLFEQIMQFEGWQKNQYLIIGNGENPEQVWTPILLDFKNAWRRCNGSYLDPLNMFVYFPEVAHRKLGFAPENFQIWTGLFSDELTAASFRNGAALEQTFKQLYWIPRYSSRQIIGEVIKPFCDIDYIRLLMQSSIHFGSVNFRKGLMAFLEPKFLKFENGNQRHLPFPVAREALDRALADYQKSWYGKNIRPDLTWPKDAMKNYRLWPIISFWAIASLCEHLLKQGYKINKSQRF